MADFDSKMTLLAEDMLAQIDGPLIESDDSSLVAKYYANRSVFITGATGFIGKVNT